MADKSTCMFMYSAVNREPNMADKIHACLYVSLNIVALLAFCFMTFL